MKTLLNCVTHSSSQKGKIYKCVSALGHIQYMMFFCALKIGKDTFFFQTHAEQNSSIKLNMTSTLTSLLLTENRRLTAQVWYPAVLFSLL